MRLASDDIVINLSPAVTITLVPTLRAAYRLERKYDGFDKLLHLVSRGNLSTIAAVIREGSGDSVVTRYLEDALDDMPLHMGIERLAVPVSAFVLALAGADGESPKTLSAAERITFEEFHSKLFRIATGWLGWSPDQAWSASPAEIIEAHKGRTEMLAAIFGSGKHDADKSTDLSKGGIDSNTRSRLNALGDLTNVKMP